MKKYLYIIICSIIILFTITPLYSEDVTLIIGENEYIKLMPEDVKGLKSLVRTITDMYNTANKDNIKQSKETLDKIKLLSSQLEDAKLDLKDARSSTNTIIETLNSNKVDIITEIKGLDISTTKRFALGAGIQTTPLLDAFEISALGIFNITNTFYTGFSAGIFTSLKDEVSVRPMIGLYIGSWIF